RMFFFSSRRRHTRCYRDWSSDVCSSDLLWRQFSERGQIRHDERSPVRQREHSRSARRDPAEGQHDDVGGGEQAGDLILGHALERSEERRVGKGCRRGWGRYGGKKKGVEE